MTTKIRYNNIEFFEIPYLKMYYISKLGNVLSLNPHCHKEPKLLTEEVSNRGYVRVNIKGKKFSIHRLVASIFIPNLENKPEINHKDGNKLNNKFTNLEWCTSSENMLHCHKNNLQRRSRHRLGMIGKLHQQSKKVNQYDLNRNLIKTWDSLHCITRADKKLDYRNIHKNCQNKINSAYGFRWEYAE